MKALWVTACVATVIQLLGPAAHSTPDISSGAEILEDGSSCAIHGHDFGPKSVPAPAHFDDFEAGTPNETLSGWEFSTSHGRCPVYSTTYARPNSERSAKCLFDGGQWLSSFGVTSVADITEVYVDAWYLYSPADPPSRNHKLIRLYAGRDSGVPNLYFSHDCHQESGRIGSDGVSEGNSYDYNDYSWSLADENWIHIQGYVKASSTAMDDGIALLWINCDKITDEPAFRTRTEANPTLWHGVWFGNYLGHDAVSGCPESPGASYTYWDDVYVDFTQARVELGNAPTYDACTHREIQIPTQWSDTSITITVNGGSFETGSELYLFVVDQPGIVSAGYPVVLGGQSGGDATPPADVTTLAVGSTTETTITLTWTASGDDATTGTATTYDLRYSTSNITAGNWASATEAAGEPAPQAAGNEETFTVTGLTAGTIYYFALKVADEVPNWSGLSNVASGATMAEADVTPPGAVDDLGAVEAGETWVELAWTAVGDDGESGTARTYDLRYSELDINTDARWNSATQVSDEPEPGPAGEQESLTVDGLEMGTTYYFALKVADEVPNWSARSNVLRANTKLVSDPLGITRGSWSDGNFVGADWSAITVVSGTSSIDLLSTQASGGSPDAFREIDVSLGATPRDSVTAIHLYQPIAWDLDAFGPIQCLDAGLDFRSLDGAPARVGLVIHQVATSESYAWIPTETAADPDWTSYAIAGLTAEDFVPVTPGPGVHPGLGVGMGLVLFGFLVGQCATQAGGATTIQSGVDNWWIRVNPEGCPGGGRQSSYPQITRLSLRGNYPNPFKPETRIVFDLPSTQPVLLRVFDPAGRLVRTLVHESLPAGMHAAVWLADDDRGRRVPSGVYLYCLQAGERVATRTACVIE